MRSKKCLTQVISLCLIYFLGYNQCISQVNVNENFNLFEVKESEPVDTVLANIYEDRYLNNPDDIDPETNYNAVDQPTEIVKSFSFSRQEMSNLLTADPLSALMPDKIILLFGMEKKTGPIAKKWHMMAFGMYENVRISTGIYDGIMNIANNSNLKSPIVSDSLAKVWHKEYFKRHKLKTITKFDEKDFHVRGFIFDSWQIQEILSNNASGKTPDYVTFSLGKEKVNSGIYRWHIISYGRMLNGDLLKISVKQIAGQGSKAAVQLRAASIFDKADPYPPRL